MSASRATAAAIAIGAVNGRRQDEARHHDGDRIGGEEGAGLKAGAAHQRGLEGEEDR